ncbi:hypothetical protein LOTGIDRAFT_154766 [Lottia gigantea]|uniref:Uncharacterized protein n=1 Tax=Lottia gigantea TaxID=225164 RepID=V4BEG5_LOTGI|nr:hypothetical protein LOTGIDRAFT_154766 [Lottia gigantea]ESO87264.1 hypothetical protein LOTGIDRAFT_154766 [Lottia gigantea]
MKIYVEGEDITQMCKDDSLTCKESNAPSLKETNVVNDDKEIVVVVCECDNHTCNKCKKEKIENCECQYCQEEQTGFTPKHCQRSGFERNNVFDYDDDVPILMYKGDYELKLLKQYGYMKCISRFARSIMDRLDKFQIIYNNPTATYYAGDTVYGYGWVVIKELMYVQIFLEPNLQRFYVFQMKS